MIESISIHTFFESMYIEFLDLCRGQYIVLNLYRFTGFGIYFDRSIQSSEAV